MAINPGSFIEFSGSLTEVEKPKASELYGHALDTYRAHLAADYGIHPEDLHAMKLPESRHASEASPSSLGGLVIEASEDQ